MDEPLGSPIYREGNEGRWLNAAPEPGRKVKTLTPTFEAAQDKLNVHRFKEAEIKRRYWDAGTKTFKLETTAIDLAPYLLKINRIAWKLDTEALNEWKTSNVTLELNNASNYFDERNASGFWNDGGTFLSNRSEVKIKIGLYNADGDRESLYVFTGYITDPPIVKDAPPTVQIVLKGKEIVLEDVDAENLSRRPYHPRDSYRYEDVDIFSANTIGDTSFSFTPNEHQYSMIRIYSGLGRGQERYILSHTATTFTVFPNWVTTPDITSDFEIFGENAGVGDGVNADFYTTHPGVGRVLDVWNDSVKMKQGVDYQVSQLYSSGENNASQVAKITFEAGSIPGVGERVTDDYLYWYQSVRPDWIVEQLVILAGFDAAEYSIDPVIMPNNVRVEWLQDTQGDWQAGKFFQDISTTIQAGFLRIDDIPILEWRPYWWKQDFNSWAIAGADYTAASAPYTSTTIGKSGAAWTTDQWIGHRVEIYNGTGAGQIRVVVSNTTSVLSIEPTIPWETTPNVTSDFRILQGTNTGWGRQVDWVVQHQLVDEDNHWSREAWNDDRTRLRDEHCGRRYGQAYYKTDNDYIEFGVKDTQFVEPRWTEIEIVFAMNLDATVIQNMVVETNVSADDIAYDGWVAATTTGTYPYTWTINSNQKRYIKVRVKYTGNGDADHVNLNYVIEDFRARFYPWGYTESSIRDGGATLVTWGKLLAVDDDGVPTPIANRFIKYYTRFATHDGDDYDDSDIFSINTIGKTGSAWTPSEHIGKLVFVYGGLGSGQYRLITANTADTLTVDVNWSTTPNITSDFRIFDWSAWTIVPANGQIDTVGFVVGSTRFLQTQTELQSDTVITGLGGEYPRVDEILVDYYTSTFDISVADMQGLTALSGIRQIAKMVDYEIGVSAGGQFFFRQKRNTIASADMEVSEDDRLYEIGDKKTAWDRVKNIIKVTYGLYTKIISPETELEDPPHSITKYGERIFEVSGGNLLAPPDHDLAQGLAMNYFGIFDANQVLIAHKYPEERERIKIRMKFLPRLDLSDAILVTKTKPGSAGNEFVDKIFTVLGMSLDVENWIMDVEGLEPYGN